jgi:hypothetical protein
MNLSKARAAMRAFLELSSAERAHFDKMRDDLEYIMRHADGMPSRHPDKARRRWKALEHFQAQHNL